MKSSVSDIGIPCLLQDLSNCGKLTSNKNENIDVTTDCKDIKGRFYEKLQTKDSKTYIKWNILKDRTTIPYLRKK